MKTRDVTGGAKVRRAGLGAALLALIATACLAPLAGAAAATLQKLDYTTLPGNRVQITFEFDGPVDKPRSFKTSNPARIALDFMGVKDGLSNRSVDIGAGAVHRVSTAEAGGRTRAVIQLSELVPYQIDRQGNVVRVRLESPGASGTQTASSGAGASTKQGGESANAGGKSTGASSPEGSISQVDFRRGPDGAGKVIVTLSDPSTPVDVRTEGGNVVADFMHTQIPERLQRKLDVTDFATPVQSIVTRQRGDKVHIAIKPSDTYDQIAYQTDNKFTIELKPITKEEKERQAKKEFRYTGEPLSLNFQDIEVRSVLQLIADFTGINIVVSDSVKGSITLRLQNVPWDQALDIILQTKGLDKRKNGNVMWIAPSAEIAAREQQELKAQQQVKQLAPLHSEFIRVNYAKAAQMASLISGGSGGSGGGGNSAGKGQSLLSDRGSISIDERTNTLIIRDTASNLEDIRRLVNKLDVPVRQVLIESRIVIANDDFTNELGVRFGYSRQGDAGNLGGAVIGGKQPGDTNYGGTTGFEVPAGSGNEGLMVDLPATDAAGSVGLAVGKIGSYLLQLELSAMENENRGDIISSPRVVTANQKEAFIKQGVEIPYQEASSSGATSVSFKEAVLGLTVTPQITPDDRVLLDLNVSKDSQGETTNAGPAINTQSVGTQVLVDNGETVVLGGVYERTKRHDVTRVPFFGDLPLVGWLFKKRTQINNNSELLIFVTPKILDEKLSLNQ
ncbi:MAG TPA: type IV pilus secretin PilQ [Gammaproteobacteria bacterium]|nr:type IV pilus secretin PilQ [Gammaproteobacteria bacterium]